jgi:hypothetical protein
MNNELNDNMIWGHCYQGGLFELKDFDDQIIFLYFKLWVLLIKSFIH